MNPRTQAVLERLSYERLLLSSGIRPKRRRITLDQALDAALEEPRIYAVLPALILYRPQAITRLSVNLANHPRLKRLTETLFTRRHPDKTFWGIPLSEYRSVAVTFRSYIATKSASCKSLSMNLRLSDDDKERLKFLTKRLGTGGLSATIRLLAKEKERELADR